MLVTNLFMSYQANEILSSFDDRLRLYATKQLTKVSYIMHSAIWNVSYE